MAERADPDRACYRDSGMSRVRIAAVAALLLAACRTTEAPSPAPSSLATAFATSAEAARVPRDLLVAIAKVEDGLAVPRVRTPNEDDAIPTAGPLQLRHGALNSLERGAVLLKTTEEELRSDADRALTAGALVLAELGAKHGATADLASWAPALAELSGFADEAHRDVYVHEVFATLAGGGTFEGRDGPITIGAHDLPPSLTIDLRSTLHFAATAQYPAAEVIEFSCSNNKCNSTRNGQKAEMVIIHDTEGGWNASVATLQNDPGKSVQYIVGTDGRVAQFVAKGVPDAENITAYHCGNRNYNERSVGIEHVGYATKPYTEANYAASVKLTDYLATKYAIPRDREHIIGHDQVPNLNRIPAASPPCPDSPAECAANRSYGGASKHVDPGVWEWPTFMARLQGKAKCNDATASWKCSTSTTSRFQCKDDTIEIEECSDACNPPTTDAGADGVCQVKVATTPTPTTPVDAGAPSLSLAVNDEGCALAPGASPSSLLPVLAALSLVRRRRRRC